MCVRKITWSSHSCRPVDQPKSSHLLLLLWCTAITGYHTSRKTSCNQWLATDKQEIHYWTWVSQGEKTTTNGRYLCQFKHVNAKLIVLCMSNGLICAYITDKGIVRSCTTWHLLQIIRVFQLLSSILAILQLFCNNICRR